MNIRFLMLAGLLSAVIPLRVHALPSNSAETPSAQASGAALLRSAPELMECSLEKSQALWHPTHPISLGEIPCQYLGSVGGPIETAEGAAYFPEKLDDLQLTYQLNRPSVGLIEIPQTDPFAPKKNYVDFRSLVRVVPDILNFGD